MATMAQIVSDRQLVGLDRLTRDKNTGKNGPYSPIARKNQGLIFSCRTRNITAGGIARQAIKTGNSRFGVMKKAQSARVPRSTPK